MSALASLSSAQNRRKVASRASVRSYLVATAIRNGTWNIFTGSFSTAPTAQNDFSDFGADNEIGDASEGFGTLGEFTYRYAVSGISSDYN